MKTTQHKATHAAHVDNHGMILVWCESCEWRQKVRVADLSFEDGLKAIFTARDAHEAETATKTIGAAHK